MATHPGFVGRRAELAALEKHYRARRSTMVPVYGRRRVGKTELLLRIRSLLESRATADPLDRALAYIGRVQQGL